jgi:hypothetical protein
LRPNQNWNAIRLASRFENAGNGGDREFCGNGAQIGGVGAALVVNSAKIVAHPRVETGDAVPFEGVEMILYGVKRMRAGGVIYSLRNVPRRGFDVGALAPYRESGVICRFPLPNSIVGKRTPGMPGGGAAKDRAIMEQVIGKTANQSGITLVSRIIAKRQANI